MKILLLLLFSSFLATAATTTLSFSYDTVVEENAPIPNGNQSWLFANISNVKHNTVQLDLRSNLNQSEFISRVGFNLAEGIHFSDLLFSNISGENFEFPSFRENFNTVQGNRFAFSINFLTGPPAARFDNDDMFSVSITYLGDSVFTPYSFISYNKNLNTVAHVQNIGLRSESTWITSPQVIPEQNTLLVLLSSVFTFLRRRK